MYYMTKTSARFQSKVTALHKQTMKVSDKAWTYLGRCLECKLCDEVGKRLLLGQVKLLQHYVLRGKKIQLMCKELSNALSVS